MPMTNRSLVLLATLLLAACSGTREAPAPMPEAGVSLGVGTARPAPPPAVAPRIAIAGHPVLGSPDAPVTIVEFMDYECPFCQGYGQKVFPQLRQRYIDTGQVRYVARDLPLPRHARARPAAIAAACAGEQGRYWEMHEALLATAGQLRDEDFKAHAARLGLDQARFGACRAEPRHQARLDRDLAEARALGVAGTPTLLIGASAGDVAQGRLTTTTQDWAALEQLVGRYLPR